MRAIGGVATGVGAWGDNDSNKSERTRKVDVRLPGKLNSNSYGVRPVHEIISMLKWVWTSRLLIKKSLLKFLERACNAVRDRTI